MNIAQKNLKNLVLFFLIVSNRYETTKASSTLLKKKFTSSKTLLFEKIQKNQNLLFLIGTGSLISFAFWNFFSQRTTLLKKVHLATQIKNYHDSLFTSLMNDLEEKKVKIKIEFELINDTHKKYMQYENDNTAILNTLPKEISTVMIDVLEDYNFLPKQFEFRKTNDKSTGAAMIENEHYVILIDNNKLSQYSHADLAPYKKLSLYFSILSDFVGCLGTVISKESLHKEALLKQRNHFSKSEYFSLKHRMYFLSHIAPLSFSQAAISVKAIDLYLNFPESLLNENCNLSKQKPFFMSKTADGLSFGALFLSTFDYARTFGIFSQNIISLSTLKSATWLPEEIKGLLSWIKENENEKIAANACLSNYFSSNMEYESFDSNGFAIYLPRLPLCVHQNALDQENKIWLKQEQEALQTLFSDNYQERHKDIIQKEETKASTLANSKLDEYSNVNLSIDPEIPQELAAFIAMFVERYEKKWFYKHYNIKVTTETFSRRSIIGKSETDQTTWEIQLSKFIVKRFKDSKHIPSYFHLLATFLHELAHLLHRDNLIYTNPMSLDDIAHEWQANQLFALSDKDVAEIFFVSRAFLENISEEAISKDHAPKGITVLRTFDIAKHYNLIPKDVLLKERILYPIDMAPIYAKHGFCISNLKQNSSFESATKHYWNHMNDKNYTYKITPDTPGNESKQRFEITYKRTE